MFVAFRQNQLRKDGEHHRMSADFWASYTSGVIGISLGNRLDILKTELQAGNQHFISREILDHSERTRLRTFTSLLRGAAAPILGYGALNSVLFMTYNRTLNILDPSIFDYSKLAGVDLGKIWVAGAAGGLACWVVSAPSELIKCRAQLMIDGHGSSYATARNILRHNGVRGLYHGGTITGIRDSFGYAWYFWSYELAKRLRLSGQPDPFADPNAADILVAGGIAGVVTWASIYPLDVVKTRIQIQSVHAAEHRPILDGVVGHKGAWLVAKDIARAEGLVGFYRGLSVCSLRAFLVNAVQFYVYETAMKILSPVAHDNT